MNLTNRSMPAPTWVLVLLDGNEKDILGIWGPYASEAAAEMALDELRTWPIDGVWESMTLKSFPGPATTTKINIHDSSGFQWGHGTTQTNTYNGMTPR